LILNVMNFHNLNKNIRGQRSFQIASVFSPLNFEAFHHFDGGEFPGTVEGGRLRAVDVEEGEPALRESF
jgi:hypothetical protein